MKSLVSAIVTVVLSGAWVGLPWASTASAASFKQAFAESKYSGRIRIYNNYLDFQKQTDLYGTAFGLRLGFETASQHLWGFSLGAAYYGSNDLQTNRESVFERAAFTPTVDVDILGEAYVKWTGVDTVITAGNQAIDTPFANSADAFVVPLLYTGYSIVNKSIPGLTINAHEILRVKNRQGQDFIDDGLFIAGRLGGTQEDTHGDLIFGLTYDWQTLKVQAWEYLYDEMFNMTWVQVDYGFAGERFKPYLSAHFGNQSDTGKKLLGEVDSSVIGAKAGVKAFDGDLSFGLDSVSDNRFLTPFSFFTDALYTNSMITGFGNVASGTAWKLMLTYNLTQQWWGKLSYSTFDFADDTDFSEADADVRYKFAGDFEGLSVWLRIGSRMGDNSPVAFGDLTEYRTQVQYDF